MERRDCDVPTEYGIKAQGNCNSESERRNGKDNNDHQFGNWTCKRGKSIYGYDKNGAAAQAYGAFMRERGVRNGER